MAKDRKFPNSYSLTDEIAATIRERILKGEYKIGEKIKETQIAGELKVSGRRSSSWRMRGSSNTRRTGGASPEVSPKEISMISMRSAKHWRC